MTYSTGNVVSLAYNRIPSGTVPSWLSGTVMHEMASGACIDLANMVGASIDCSSFDEKYLNILVNLTTVYTQATKEGVNTSFSLGELTVSKGASPFLTFLIDQANRSMSGVIGTSVKYSRTW